MYKIQLKFVFFLILTILMVLTGGTTAFTSDKPVVKTVNINTATEKEFEKIPLITSELAAAIVEYREENGDFAVIEELIQVDGFDSGLLQKIKAFLFLEGIGDEECSC
jgi:competence protein ComEA